MLAPLSYQVLGWREVNTSFLFIGIAVEVGFTENNLQQGNLKMNFVHFFITHVFWIVFFSDHCGIYNFDEAER